jgi:hypothetical protein
VSDHGVTQVNLSTFSAAVCAPTTNEAVVDVRQPTQAGKPSILEPVELATSAA